VPKDRFISNLRRDRVREERIDTGNAHWVETQKAQHIADEMMVQRILSHPHFDSNGSTYWADSLEWLRGHEQRVLKWDQRERGWNLLWVLRRHEDGTYKSRTETPEHKSFRRSRNQLKKIAREERKKDPQWARPEWMQDPSKLPKKPPTKVRHEG
jgi:hypothetical protein